MWWFCNQAANEDRRTSEFRARRSYLGDGARQFPPKEPQNKSMRNYIAQRRQAREYDDYLRRKVEASRTSMRADRGRSNEDVEAVFAAKRKRAAADQA